MLMLQRPPSESALLESIVTVKPLRFVIGAQEYGDCSAGVRALNRLCHWLRVLGHDASLGGPYRHQRPVKVHPEWNVKAWDGTMTGDTIAIYPDAYHGNPYRAKRVVRWALYYPGLRDGAAYYGAGEKVYYYADMFAQSTIAAAADGMAQRLHVSVFEPHILYADCGPKQYDAFWVGRGTHVVARHHWLIQGSDMLEFFHPYPTRRAFADALRRVRNFYSFDPCSAMVVEAMLCGANIFHIREDGTIRRIRENDPEMQHAFENRHAFNEAGDVVNFADDMERWECPGA